jgi:hypothetical protein|nr:MAG TPA: Major head protein [Caudoviricetes sp.]
MSDSTASINTGANGAGNTSEFKPVTTQEDLDRIIEARLGRERKKYADYDQLKEQANKLENVQAKLTEAESKLGEYHKREQVTQWKTKVAADTGVPASVLRGSTLEEITAHASSLQAILKDQPSAPIVRTQGDQPDSHASAGQKFVRELFGTN